MTLQKGQILKYKETGGERKILEILLGDIYFLSATNDFEAYGSTYTKKDIEKYFEIPKEKWEPNDGEEYFFIGCCGDIGKSFWNESGFDKYIYKIGNYFKTKEEAQKATEKFKALLKSLHE